MDILKEKISRWRGNFYNNAQYATNFATNAYISFLVYLIDLYNERVIGFSPDYDYIYYPIKIISKNKKWYWYDYCSFLLAKKQQS